MLYRYTTELGVMVEFEADVIIPQGHGFLFQVPEPLEPEDPPEPDVGGGGGPKTPA